MSKSKGASYSVGYKKPPEKSRFKKGQSGNPRGRSKKQLTIGAVLSRELGRLLEFNENGSTRKDSKLRLMVKQAVNKAVTGDFRPLQLLLKLQAPLQHVEDRHNMTVPDVSKMSDAQATETYLRLIRAPIT